MGAAAVRVAKAAGYQNAGTCEFLLAPDGQFYFLEMNTRIQVEHPVTELVTGIDLVQWQLRIARGERLPFTSSIDPRGWAIECRITSEDASNGFLPSTGRIDYLRLPGGPGVRWDSGVGIGSEVTLFYDPMLAKLIVWAPSRAEAIARMRRALDELTIQGIETSREFHLRVMEDDEYQRGAIDIQWLERRVDSLLAAPVPREQVEAAAIAAALLAERDRRQRSPRLAGAVASGGSDTTARPEQAPWARLARQQGLRDA
jgi:acetyl-CoA carboxylase biotin carboxylase subunit